MHLKSFTIYQLVIWIMSATPRCKGDGSSTPKSNFNEQQTNCSVINCYCTRLGNLVIVNLEVLDTRDYADHNKPICANECKCENKNKSISLLVLIGNQTRSICTSENKTICTWGNENQKIAHQYFDHMTNDTKFNCAIEYHGKLINTSKLTCEANDGNLTTTDLRVYNSSSVIIQTEANNLTTANTSLTHVTEIYPASIPYTWIIIAALAALLVFILSIVIHFYQKNRNQIARINNEIRSMAYKRESSAPSPIYVNEALEDNLRTQQGNIAQPVKAEQRRSAVNLRVEDNQADDYLVPVDIRKVNHKTKAVKLPKSKMCRPDVERQHTSTLEQIYEEIN